MNPHPYCICIVVSSRSIQHLLEGGGRGAYRDDHPWLVANEFLTRAKANDERLVILFATDDDPDGKPVPLHFSHWSTIENLQVVELHRAKWETICDFGTLKEVNPIWSDIDSVLLKASDDELRREKIEGIRQHRFALDEHRLRPYAICETPPFVVAE